MYDNLRPFTLAGRLTEASILSHKESIEHHMSNYMRDQGYVEVLDLEAQWNISWNKDKECFDFEVTVYGAECDEPWDTAGLLNGKMILKSTANHKSEQSSEN